MEKSARTPYPNCETRLFQHAKRGVGRYRPFPNLLVCPNCWTKYDPQPDGRLVRVNRYGRVMRNV